MWTSARRAPTTATSTPCARTRPSPSTASANRATKETASSARVSGISDFPLIKLSETQWGKHKDTICQFAHRTCYRLHLIVIFLPSCSFHVSGAASSRGRKMLFFLCLKCWFYVLTARKRLQEHVRPLLFGSWKFKCHLEKGQTACSVAEASFHFMGWTGWLQNQWCKSRPGFI